MNNFMYSEQNAKTPVTYVEVGICIHVKFVVRHVVKRAVLQNINAYIVVSALSLVICVVRHSVKRAVSKHINAYI
jgi:hypothetical protein